MSSFIKLVVVVEGDIGCGKGFFVLKDQTLAGSTSLCRGGGSRCTTNGDNSAFVH
jgi:hypothetical protein